MIKTSKKKKKRKNVSIIIKYLMNSQLVVLNIFKHVFTIYVDVLIFCKNDSGLELGSRSRSRPPSPVTGNWGFSRGSCWRGETWIKSISIYCA
jgi:hypothetical protein